MKYKGRAYALTLSLLLAMLITADTYWVYGSFNLMESIHIVLICIIIVILLWIFGRKYDNDMLFAYKDALTGIYNRRFVSEIFPKMMSQVSSKNEKLNVIVLDVNKFKQINDTHGHEKGDAVLKSISDVIAKSVRKNDIVARWGGDEFLILTACSNEFSAFKITQRIDQNLQKTSQDLQLDISVSMRTAVYPDDAITANQLIRVADDNMYTVKHRWDSFKKVIEFPYYASATKQYKGDKFEIEVNTRTRIVMEKNRGFCDVR